MVAHSKAAIQNAVESLKVLSHPTLTDDEKEALLRRDTIRSLKILLRILFQTAICLGVPTAMAISLTWLGLSTFDELLAASLNPWDLLGALTFSLAFFKWTTKSHSPQSQIANRYSFSEQILYRVAFATGQFQIRTSAWEDRLLQTSLKTFEAKQPIFITGLPRGGTTILLEVLAKCQNLYTHKYLDLPFLLTPYFWSRFTGFFRKSESQIERAHGDGIEISADSPEAFEEMLWMPYWPQQYDEHRILTWNSVPNESFLKFFRNHMKKIILIRSKKEDPLNLKNARYVSKNNLNISRLSWISENLPDSKVLIPFRDPFQHSASLLLQHINFLNLHKSDPFFAEYMKGIGHFDFGINLRPVDFNGWVKFAPQRDATKISFWLEYWVSAYEFLISQRSKRIQFLDYDRFCSKPDLGMTSLANYLELDARDLISKASEIKPGRWHQIDTNECSPDLSSRAVEIHRKLVLISINSGDIAFSRVD